MKGSLMTVPALARSLLGIALTLALSAATAPAAAQRATERYIPIGQSPGISGRLTVIGTIQAVDPATRSFSLASPSGSRAVAVAAGTHIWLDRSKQLQTSLEGGFADLRPGRRAEIRFRDPAQGGVADWVKVEIPAPDRP